MSASCVQLCVEKCPDRYLTLVKAKLGKPEDRDYYSSYCKDGVDFTKLVRFYLTFYCAYILNELIYDRNKN